MKKSLIQQASKINKKTRKKRTWQRIISVFCCLAVFCTSYSLILPAISLESNQQSSVLSSSDVTLTSGTELIKTVEKVDSGDLSETVHWVVEDVTDAFNVKTRQVRIYGEGEMPSGSTPWRTYSTTIQKAIVEDGITNISSNAFKGITSLVSAELGNDITVIGSSAFSGCSKFAKVNIPDSVIEIQDSAFGGAYDNTPLSELKLNDGLEKITGKLGGKNIKSIYIPKTVTSMSDDVFDYNSLTEVIIDEENTVYASDSEHKSVLSKDGTTLIRLLRNVTGDYTIPDGVTTIKRKAISSCSISSVKIPDTVNDIQTGNFESCPNIKELNFPVLKKWSAESYDNFLVTGCSSLIKVTFKGFVEDYNYSNFGNNTLYNCSSLKEVVFPDEVYEKVTTLGQRVFSNTSISGELFSKFTNLKTLSNGAGYPVDNAVFSNCNAVTKIVLGENLSKIQNGVFNSCLNVKEIVLNSKNLTTDFKKTSASTQSFEKLISCNKLTIGKTVDKLNKTLMNAIFENDIKDVVFEGPNVLEIESGIDGPAPVNELGGTYYADADGVLYKLESDGENNIATLAYFPSDFSTDSYNVPATITADSVTYNVTAVGKAAFKDAKIKSVSFSNPNDVSISNIAFYNCENLKSVNDTTEITAVKALFNSVGSGAFFGTKLTGDSEKNKGTVSTDPISTMKGDETANFKISIANGNADATFSLYTGQTQTVNVSVSNSNNTEDSIGRTYIKYSGSEYNLPSSIGETLNNNGYEYTFYESDIEGIYYYEYRKPASGVTGAFSFLLSYPSPESAGGIVQVWSEIFTQDEIDALDNGVKFTEASESFHQYEWKTVPRNITVNESVSSNGSLMGSGDNDQKSYVSGMKFKISADSSNTGRDGIDTAVANDLIKSFDFTTTLTLPTDFQFDDDIKAAINSGNYYCINTKDNKGNITNVNVYVTVSGESFSIISLNTSAENLSIEYPDDNKQIIIRYSIYNKSKTTEISDYSFEITYKQELFYTNKTISSGETFDFENKVDVVNNYTYSESKDSSKAATATVTAGEPKLTISKTDAVIGNLSDKHNYKIKVSNTSASTYTDFSYLTDSLPQYVYIPGEDIQKMMTEEYGDRLSITITNAEFALNTSSISGNTVKSVVGNDCKITNQNTGSDVPYSGASAAGTDVDITTGIIRIYWEGSVLYSEYNSVKKAVDTSDPDSLKNILDEFGFFVTRSAIYTLKWDFNSDFVMYGGKSFELNVYSKAMDTFMMLYYDNDGTYINSYESLGQNTAYAYNSSDAKVATSKATSNQMHYREIRLNHAMFKDGKVVDSNSGLADGDIIQQTAMFKHFGNGTYGALPLVNKISSNQLLLIRKDLNESNTELASFETKTVNGVEYYVLKYAGTAQTLTNVYTNEGQLAAEINLTAGGTIVHWYFDNLPASEYIESVDYQTMIDISNESEAKWNINVESWLNDHQTHRLHLKGGADGISLDFDKKIVTNPTELGIDGYVEDNPIESTEFSTLSENQKLDTFSFVGEGNNVTYLLKLKSTGSEVSVKGSNIYDCMPWKYDWQKADISIKYVYDKDQVTVTNPQSWDVTKDDPSTTAVETSGEYSYITWGDDFNVHLKANAQIFMYVTLSFPTDDTWNSFVTDNNGATLYNKFFLLGIYREVSHELKLPVKARIQKGVYELGGCRRRSNDSISLDVLYSIYKSDNTRLYYMNTDSRVRVVTYYATICNSGQNKMYLNDMQDILPKGFKFLYLVNCTDINSSYMNSSLITTNAKISGNSTILNAGKTLATIDGADLVTATVAASVSNRSENYQKITFKFSKADSVSGEKTLKYDETYGKYYLSPGEAICFGYLCSIGEAAQTDDTANNYLALPIDDLGEGVIVNGKSSVASSNNGLIENDGSCAVIDNDIAESLGFNGYDADTKWYKSDVSVKRGEIVPEISKKAIKRIDKEGNTSDYSGFARSDDKIIWKVTAQNTGEYSLTDYTISDTMQKMNDVLHRFEGTVNYNVYEKGTSTANYSTASLLKINRDSDTITVVSSGNYNQFREKGTTTALSNEIEVEYGKDYEGQVKLVDVSNHNEYRIVRYYFRIDKDENGLETLSIHFESDVFAIPGGGKVELNITVSRTDQTNTTSGHFRNDVQLIPNAENEINSRLLNYDRVMNSEKVKQDGNVIGVANNSSFDVVNGYGTTSVKTVTELDSTDALTTNTASSEDTNNTITLKAPESKFEYKSSVHLPKEVATKSLVIIDTLPEIGDHAVFQEDDSRGSQFKVKFIINYTPVVELVEANGTTTIMSAGTDYTIDYSSKTVFDSDDWNAISSFDSTVDPSTHRAIRLNVTKEIPKDATVNLYYRAVADSPETVNEGEIAYSSFGYSYQVSVDGFARQEAAPLKVGVRAPNIAYLSKQLSTRDGNSYITDTDETFKFIVYKGDSINLTGNDEAAMAAKLGSTEFTVLTLTVKAGESISDSVALSGLKQYSYSETGNTFVEGTADWELTADEKYTIYEYGYSDAYLFKAFGKNDSSNYTFTYLPATVQNFVCENILKTWQVSVVKKDVDDENIKLQGAVFGLYSTDAADEISDTDLADLVTGFGLSSTPSKTETVTIDGTPTTVYLKDISSTDELGVVSWTDLINSKYAVKELKAPDGYLINEDESNPNLRLISQPAVISLDSYTSVASYTNKTYYNLPKTGGVGTSLFYIIGALLIASSVIFYVYGKRRKCERGVKK